MMFALNFTAIRFSLKFSVFHFLIHIKSQTEEIFAALTRQITTFPAGKIGGGARGEEPIWQTSFAKFCGSLSAVPSPGYKKVRYLD